MHDEDYEDASYAYWPRGIDDHLAGDYYWAKYVVEILKYEAEEDRYARELRYLKLNDGAEGRLPCPGCGGCLLPAFVWPKDCPCGGRGFVHGVGGRKVTCPAPHRLRLEVVPPHPVPATCMYCDSGEG